MSIGYRAFMVNEGEVDALMAQRDDAAAVKTAWMHADRPAVREAIKTRLPDGVAADGRAIWYCPDELNCYSKAFDSECRSVTGSFALREEGWIERNAGAIPDGGHPRILGPSHRLQGKELRRLQESMELGAGWRPYVEPSVATDAAPAVAAEEAERADASSKHADGYVSPFAALAALKR